MNGLKGPTGTNEKGPTGTNGKGILVSQPGFPSDESIQEESQEPGLSLNSPENHPLTRGTFKTRKTDAMRKKGLNLKGNPLGTSLNSLAIRVKVRKAQAEAQALKNTKKNKKKTLKDRKKEALDKILQNVTQSKEDAIVKGDVAKLVVEDSPKTRLKKEKKEEWNLAAKQQQEEEDFENLFENRHGEQATKMEGMDPQIAIELLKATTKAEESNREAMKREERLWMGPRRQKGPKSNTNLPNFRGELDETTPKRRNARNK